MFKKTLLATTALTVLSAGVAFSEMKVSGSIEYNYLSANADAAAQDFGKSLGADTTLRFNGSGDLGAGGKYAITYDLLNAAQDVTQLDLTFGATTIEFGQNNSAGVEDVKALLPYVNNRFADIAGSTMGIDDVQDNSSGTTSAAINQKLGNIGTVSVAYNPNIRNSSTNPTDVVAAEARAETTPLLTGTGTSLSGSFRGSLGVDGLTVGLGYMKDNSSVALNDDRESLTYGASYNFGTFAIGYQRIENTSGAALKTETKETEADQYGVSFAASDQLSVGIYQIKQEETTQGAANSPELKANLLSIGYKFGAAKVSYDYLDVEKANNSAGDTQAHKIKIGMAF